MVGNCRHEKFYNEDTLVMTSMNQIKIVLLFLFELLIEMK